MTLENKEKLNQVFGHGLQICQGIYNEDDLQAEARFLNYLAHYLNSQAKTLRELDDILKEVK